MHTDSLQAAKSQVLSLMEEATPASAQARMQNISQVTLKKVERVCGIFKDYPDLSKDPEAVRSFLKFSKDNADPSLKKLRRELCAKSLITFDGGIAKITDPGPELITPNEMASLIHSLPPDMGRFSVKNKALTISEKALMNLKPDHFWNFIKSQEVQSLTIRQENGETITYDKTILSQIAEKKPPIKSLTEKFTLEFEDGKELVETHAKLLLCGKWFKRKLSGSWKLEKLIDLKGIPFNGFCGILQKIESGELSPDISSNEYDAAVDFLDYVPYQPPVIPGIYGKEQWEKKWGKVGDVPPLPKELFKALNGPCPVYNKEKKADGPKFRDTHLVFYVPPSVDGKKLGVNMMEEIAKSDKFGENKIGYEHISQPIRAANLQEEGGYWFAMAKPLEETRNMKTEDQVNYLKANLPKEYDLPSTIEALIYCLMPYAEKKECTLGRGEPYWTYTRCKDQVQGVHVVVGAVAASGLFVIINDDANCHVCVAPVRKFFRS